MLPLVALIDRFACRREVVMCSYVRRKDCIALQFHLILFSTYECWESIFVHTCESKTHPLFTKSTCSVSNSYSKLIFPAFSIVSYIHSIQTDLIDMSLFLPHVFLSHPAARKSSLICIFREPHFITTNLLRWILKETLGMLGLVNPVFRHFISPLLPYLTVLQKPLCNPCTTTCINNPILYKDISE